jgi:hypothetical protein
MPFAPEETFYGPLAIPEGMNVTPTPEVYNRSVLGAAFRSENPIASYASSFSIDPDIPLDPNYRPWEALQGTKYEPYAARFVGARDATDVQRMKLQIDGEEQDDAVIRAAGWKGTISQFAAGLLSPTNLLPLGEVVAGAKGISIAKSALSIGTSAAAAAAVDEAFLHATQQTRTGQESAFAIGGSLVLGGFLGAAAGKLGQAEFKAASKQVEEAMAVQRDYDGVFRSLSAGSAVPDNLKLRGEFAFQVLNKVPGLRALVRTDPVLRRAISPLNSSRAGLVELVDTPLEFAVNAEGKSVRAPEGSVEARIRDRERTDLAKAVSFLHHSYAEYWKDGPTGFFGTITAPLTQKFQHLAGRSNKLSASEFMDEVGTAMSGGDVHPVAQVQTAAEAIRSQIFDKIKDDATAVGIFDEGMQIDHAKSYFTRVYDEEKIRQHWGDGTKDDMSVVLKAEFGKRRDQAQRMLAEDDTLKMQEFDHLKLKEEIQQNRKVLKKITDKAKAKATRALSSIAAGKYGGRLTGAIRKAQQDRVAGLTAGVITPEAKTALKESLADARGLNRLEPHDILKAIRDKGGIKDPRSGGMWNGKGWGKGAQKTDLEHILDTRTIGIRRNDGMDADYMREALIEDGYLHDGASINDMYDAIGRSAGGEKVFSSHDHMDVARWEAAKTLRSELEAMGVDVTDPLDRIIEKIHGPNNRKVQKAKAGEADRAKGKAAKAEGSAGAKVLDALDRLEQAKDRLKEIESEVGPKIKAEIEAATKEIAKVKSLIGDAKSAREKETFYASADDAEIDTHVREAIQSILSMKPGESHGVHAFAKPTRARTMDVPDEVLAPWLESNVETVMHQYFRSLVPQIEMMRTYGDLEGTRAIQAMVDEATVKMEGAKSAKERTAIATELDSAKTDFAAMRDRLLGTYGAPANPRSGWVKAGRVARSLSYMGYLGGMTISAIPDVAGVIGRSGIEASFGTVATALTNPRRFFSAAKDMADIGASAEWWLNTRAMSMSDVFDRQGRGSRLERMMSEGARNFSVVTGMVPWNVGWKSVGGAAVASRMAKAADAVAQGKATTKQLRVLAANNIEPWMAERIAKQIDQFGDKNGMMWLPQGGKWDDKDAYMAFQHAMNREFDMMVVTPGQDKPLAFSNEFGKFFLQFKSFGFSAYHRTLVAGLQRADADIVAQFTTALLLGGLVSNIKSDIGGYDRKEGGAFWTDALDKSGLAGWMMEPYGVAAATFPQLSVGGQAPSRFQARSKLAGALGPSVDMAMGVTEAMAAVARGEGSYKDIRKLMKPLPGNNHPLLNGTHLFNLYSRLEDFLVSATGAKPRN